MITISAPQPATSPGEALYAAASRAILAPSIHNTQPWRFVVRGGCLDLYADPRRRAPVVDPHGRQLTISCGAALFAARVALAAGGQAGDVALLPDPAQPELLARVCVSGPLTAPDEAAARLDAVAADRHSNRRRFSSDAVGEDVLDALQAAASREGAWLQPVDGLDDRITLARLTQRADAMQTADAAYRAELRAWTAADPTRDDGVPAAAVPHVTGGAHDDIPIRDFDTHGAGELPSETASRITQTMTVLGTAEDNPRAWLSAGQALQHVLLELTGRGLVASIYSQVCEVPRYREQLRTELRLAGHPHVVLRIGYADPTPATPRRPASDVITVE